MPHLVTYNRQTGEITGRFRVSSSQYMPIHADDVGLAEVTEPEHLKLIGTINPMTHRIRGAVVDGKIENFEVGSRYRGKIVLSVAEGGRTEIPADGASSLRIQAAVYEANDKKRLGEPVPITFQVTRGSLSRRRVETSHGTAVVELRSVAETVPSRITASSPGLESSSLTVQFIPPDEYGSPPRTGDKADRRADE